MSENTNINEEIFEVDEIKMEELTDDSLDEVSGGWTVVTNWKYSDGMRVRFAVQRQYYIGIITRRELIQGKKFYRIGKYVVIEDAIVARVSN